jgi:hypothetical protein
MMPTAQTKKIQGIKLVIVIISKKSFWQQKILSFYCSSLVKPFRGQKTEPKAIGFSPRVAVVPHRKLSGVEA